MRKLAFRYRRLKEIYNSYKGNVGGKFTSAGSYCLTTGVKNKFVEDKLQTPCNEPRAMNWKDNRIVFIFTLHFN